MKVRRRTWLLAGLPLLILVILVVAQLVLPGIAAQRLRDQLSHSGRVLQVRVEAFPAVELLWHHADHVVIRMASYRSSTRELEHQLSQLGDVDRLDAWAARFTAGLLTVRNASLHKRGNQVVARATVTEADVRSSLPGLDSVVPVTSGDGQLTLQGTATLFGVTATVDASVRPQGGALVVSPDLPFGSLATITVFSSPTVHVRAVSAAPVAGGFVASARASIG